MSITGQPNKPSVTSPNYVNSESDLIYEIRIAYAKVEDVLAKLPSSRRKSIALTELETSAMFALKAALSDE